MEKSCIGGAHMGLVMLLVPLPLPLLASAVAVVDTASAIATGVDVPAVIAFNRLPVVSSRAALQLPG